MGTGHFWAEFRKYSIVLLVSALLFIGFSEYIALRRGYYDLYIANKVFAGVAAINFGIIFLLGPLTRLFNFADHYLELRKEFGIVGFFLALFHVVASFFLLPQKFSIEYFFTRGMGPFIFGLIATILLIFTFIISFEKIINLLGRARWWKMQYWGMRAIFIFTVLHVFVMKWKGWVEWYQVGGGKGLAHPNLPGAGLLVGWFMIFVLLIRIAELFGRRAGRVMWYTTVIFLPLIYLFTFWRGSTNFSASLPEPVVQTISSISKPIIKKGLPPRMIEIVTEESGEKKLVITNFTNSLWLCIQPDWYSKPNNESCNTGLLIEQSPFIIQDDLGETASVLKLYDDSNMGKLYDQAVVRRLKDGSHSLTQLSELCGTLTRDVGGSFTIDRYTLLTEPGWRGLLPFVNSSVCVEGEKYDKSNSFRVYFINE